jgi:hypothetical protein
MLQAILVWSGAVLALGLMLVMALGPVIVEVDSWWYERKHNRRRAARKSEASKANAAAVAAPRPARVVHPAA